MRPVAVGGIVAVGFVDEGRVLVGSHSGVAIVDALSGEPTDRTADVDGSYEWFTESPPSGTWADVDGPHTVPVAGLWGGDLPVETSDGWLIERDAQGAKVTGPDGATIAIEDGEEARALGFSPEGRLVIYATSSTLYVAAR